MKRSIFENLIIIVLLSSPFTCSFLPRLEAQTEHTPCHRGNLDQEEPATAEAIEKFWRTFQTGIQKNDKVLISKIIAYPLSVGFSSGKDLEISSKRQFLSEYSRIFPKELREMLLRQRAECIRRVGVKGFSIGEGQVWFDRYPDGQVKIFSITVVVYPGE